MLTRLAPTPSGFLHLGNIYNFLLNWLWAKSNGSKVLLRIDDGDAERKRLEYVEDIFHVLDWLGLYWDIGPTGPTDFEKHWSQIHRKDLYENVLKELTEKQLVFGCDCSRKKISNNIFSDQCTCKEKLLPLSMRDVAWRMKLDGNPIISLQDRQLGIVSVDLTLSAGSFVVKKKDGMPAYQICSLADDQYFGVTHICRGEDLLPSTAMQLFVDKQMHFNYLNNCNFWHHRLLLTTDGSKLSKSAGTMRSSIIGTISKKQLLTGFAQWMGCKEGSTLNEMLASAAFSDY